MAKLSTQTAIIGLGRLINMAAAAGTMIVLARIMPDKESYGAILLLITLYLMLSQIFAAGLPQAVYYFLPRYASGEQRGFLTQIQLLLIIAGLLLGAGFYFGADVIGHLMHAPKLPVLLRVFALYPLFMLPTLSLEGTLLFHNHPVTLVVYNAAVRIGMFGSLVVPIWLHFSLVTTVSVWVAEAAVMCLWALGLSFSTVRKTPLVWHRQMLHDVWGFSLPLALLTIINLCGSYMDRFVVSHFFGAAAFGVYANATLEVPTVTMVTSATAVVLLAEFSRRSAAGDDQAVLTVWHRATIKTALIILASFGFLVFWGHEAMLVLFSNRFAESGNIFSILVWIIPLNLFSMRPLYIAAGSTRILLLLSLLDMVNGITCMLIFGHFFGLLGIAIGVTVTNYLGIFPWVHVYVRKVTHIGWKAFMPWKTIAIAYAIALTAGGITQGLRLLLPRSWPLLLTFAVALASFLVLYTAGLYGTKLLPYLVPARYLPGRKFTPALAEN